MLVPEPRQEEKAVRTKVPVDRINILATIALFRGCSDRELAEIDSLVDDIEAEPGEVLTKEGHAGQESFIIVDGEAEVTLRGETKALLGPGEFFGEMALLDPGRPRSATVRAVTPMRLLVIDPRSLSRLMDQPVVARRVLQGIIQRLRVTEGAPE